MIPFLKSVAMELAARYGSELCRFTFVVPHKRGVTFMRRYLEEALEGHLLRMPLSSELPRIITISELTEAASGLRKGRRLELLFSLYDAYRALYIPKRQPPTAKEFEEFRSWGETVISDFNDVDMYCVQADELFRNLADFNEIRTDFLTDDQKLVIEKYFGVSNPGDYITSFWKHCSRGTATQKRFLSLWEKLSPLYHEYRKRLIGKGLSYPGMAYGLACEAIESKTYRFNSLRVAFVGFNALSTVERRLFKTVKALAAPDGASLADFFWDAPGPALKQDSPVDAAGMLLKNVKDFPCSIPEMGRYSDFDTFPSVIHQVSCPGNTAQAKVAGQLLRDILKDKDSSYIDKARVAVVLPDEGLLFPMFHSIPPDMVHNVNLTMGYPLRLSAVAAFVNQFRQIHSRARMSHGEYRLFSKDAGTLLGHPLTRIMLGQEVTNMLNGGIIDSHQYFVTLNEMRKYIEAFSGEEAGNVPDILNALFSPLPADDDPASVCNALCRVLKIAKTALEEAAPAAEGDVRRASLEGVHLDRYLEEFGKFAALCKEYGIRMDARSALNMACRLLAADSVSMQGEPLSGLQIMGMLETRALDFDYLIIPSMNERIFPRKLRARTFIPDTLRMGFGIATTRFQEEIFAYHFYRLIARAKEVHLLYDASQGGLRSGDPSRYLLQLQYFFGNHCKLRKSTARFRLQSPAPARPISIGKTGRISDRLDMYLTGNSGKNLSASSLKTYINCPVKFCMEYLLDKKVEDAPTDFMGAAVIGTVLHETMQELYNSLEPSPMHPAIVTPAQIDLWLGGSSPIGTFADIREIAMSKIRKYYMAGGAPDVPLTGDALITLELLLEQVRWCLMADRKIAPFEYLASEEKEMVAYTLPNGMTVNMTLIIDRLDRITMPDGSKRLRIVDYKTGSDDTSFKSINDLFAIGGRQQAIFQLMLYAMLYSIAAPDIVKDEPIALSIYKTRGLNNPDAETLVSHDGVPVFSHLPYMPEFKTRVDEMLTSLFDTDVPLVPPPDMPTGNENNKKPCSFCHFKALCLG